AAYLMPFLWCYNEAFILDGSPLAIAYALVTALIGALLIARAAHTTRVDNAKSAIVGLTMFAAAIGVGGSTVWLGAESVLTLVAAALGIALLAGLRAFGTLPQTQLAKA